MSLARAFTKRIKRTDDGASSPPRRNITVRYPPGSIDPSTISSPIELLSTTNVQALTAPDIRKISSDSSSASSTHSGDDSLFSTIDRSFISLGDSSPATPITPPNESKDFFQSKLLPAAAITPTPAEPAPAPILPQRSPSHSKRAHVELSRKRSIQRMSPPPTSLNRTPSVRDTADMFSHGVLEQIPASTTPHPFGAELAKVNEVAEEFGAKVIVLDEEEQFMLSKGLRKFGVEDYINEIAGLYGGVYEDQLGVSANPWI